MKIPKPKITVDEVFGACLSNMHKANREKFLPCLPTILAETQAYEKSMEDGNPHNVAQCNEIQGLPKDEVEKLYTAKLSKLRQPARKYYDEILSLSPRGICPYCRQQIVSTLDHYYPKAHYISLVISPTNLVPSCSNCNKNKSDIIIRQKEDALLSPYYEDSDAFVWLEAALVKDLGLESPAMSFYVHPPADCDPVLRRRIEHQFTLLRLNGLYSKHAAEELIGVSKRHLRIFRACGSNGVKESISESIEENEYRSNSWQAAMYRALDDEWYLDEWLPKQDKYRGV